MVTAVHEQPRASLADEINVTMKVKNSNRLPIAFAVVYHKVKFNLVSYLSLSFGTLNHTHSESLYLLKQFITAHLVLESFLSGIPL